MPTMQEAPQGSKTEQTAVETEKPVVRYTRTANHKGDTVLLVHGDAHSINALQADTKIKRIEGEPAKAVSANYARFPHTKQEQKDAAELSTRRVHVGGKEDAKTVAERLETYKSQGNDAPVKVVEQRSIPQILADMGRGDTKAMFTQHKNGKVEISCEIDGKDDPRLKALNLLGRALKKQHGFELFDTKGSTVSAINVTEIDGKTICTLVAKHREEAKNELLGTILTKSAAAEIITPTEALAVRIKNAHARKTAAAAAEIVAAAPEMTKPSLAEYPADGSTVEIPVIVVPAPMPDYVPPVAPKIEGNFTGRESIFGDDDDKMEGGARQDDSSLNLGSDVYAEPAPTPIEDILRAAGARSVEQRDLGRAATPTGVSAKVEMPLSTPKLTVFDGDQGAAEAKDEIMPPELEDIKLASIQQRLATVNGLKSAIDKRGSSVGEFVSEIGTFFTGVFSAIAGLFKRKGVETTKASRISEQMKQNDRGEFLTYALGAAGAVGTAAAILLNPLGKEPEKPVPAKKAPADVNPKDLNTLRASANLSQGR